MEGTWCVFDPNHAEHVHVLQSDSRVLVLLFLFEFHLALTLGSNTRTTKSIEYGNTPTSFSSQNNILHYR